VPCTLFRPRKKKKYRHIPSGNAERLAFSGGGTNRKGKSRKIEEKNKGGGGGFGGGQSVVRYRKVMPKLPKDDVI